MVLISVDGRSTVADLYHKTGHPQRTESALSELEKGGSNEARARFRSTSFWSHRKNRFAPKSLKKEKEKADRPRFKTVQQILLRELSSVVRLVRALPAVPEPEQSHPRSEYRPKPRYRSSPGESCLSGRAQVRAEKRHDTPPVGPPHHDPSSNINRAAESIPMPRPARWYGSCTNDNRPDAQPSRHAPDSTRYSACRPGDSLLPASGRNESGPPTTSRCADSYG